MSLLILGMVPRAGQVTSVCLLFCLQVHGGCLCFVFVISILLLSLSSEFLFQFFCISFFPKISIRFVFYSFPRPPSPREFLYVHLFPECSSCFREHGRDNRLEVWLCSWLLVGSMFISCLSPCASLSFSCFFVCQVILDYALDILNITF